MKTKTKIGIWLIIIWLIFILTWFSIYEYKNFQIEKLEKELQKARIPSNLEKNKKRLEFIRNLRSINISENKKNIEKLTNLQKEIKDWLKYREEIEAKIRCEQKNIIWSWNINCKKEFTNFLEKS